jgi:hypothetical protein
LESGDKVKEAFGIEGYVSFNNYSFTVTTYDKTKAEHKKEVRKVYIPLKKTSFKVKYGCDTEKTLTNNVKLKPISPFSGNSIISNISISRL